MKYEDKTRQSSQTQKALPYHKKSLFPIAIIMILLCLALAIFLPSSLDTPTPVATANVQRSPTTTVTPLLTPTPTVIPTPSPITPFPPTFAQQLATMQAKGRYFSHGNTQLPEIALTFDDGPNGPYTAQILDILAHYHAKATFFCLGKQVQKYPALVQRAYREGHLIANHTWGHPYLPKLSVPSIIWQINSAGDIIQRTTGIRPTLFRAPYGATNSKALTAINSLGLTLVQWNVDPRDWSTPGANAIYARVLARTQNGAIILLHDGGGDRSQTVAALPRIIQRLQSQGFQLVTLQRLIQDAHQLPPTKKRSGSIQNEHSPMDIKYRQWCMIIEERQNQGCS